MQDYGCCMCSMTNHDNGPCRYCGGVTYPLECSSTNDQQGSSGGFWTVFLLLSGMGILMQISALFL